MVRNLPIDPETDALEPPEDGDDPERVDGEEGAFRERGQQAGGEDEVVREVADHEDGEPERGELGGGRGGRWDGREGGTGGKVGPGGRID